MALFGKGSSKRTKGDEARTPEVQSVPSKSAHCRICNGERNFSRCWQRLQVLTQCSCCNVPLPNAAELYKKRVPACPKCGEWLEQPGFEYGLCDSCSSKYELTAGCRPVLIPNQQQRSDMDKVGRAWSHD